MCAATEKTPVFNERGIITRIYLENFVTYDKVEVRPSANLNLIIGPNGTGKSTIVCAIVLGLGGKPALVGRAPLASQYVKTDCESALIEIQLKDTATTTIKISRRFNIHNQTTWMLNGKPTQAKEIQKLIRSLNIQVDNLCQLLPQDKVQDFSKMNSQQLLENTQRSVGDPLLLECHTKLKELRQRGKEIGAVIANKTSLLDSETQKYEGMKGTVGNIKEKKIIKNKIKALKQKKAWITYDLSRKQLCDAKVGRDQAAAEMKELDEQLKPINETINELEKNIKNLKKIVDKHNSDLFVKTSKVQKILDEIQNNEIEIREVEKNREHKIKNEENRDHEISAVEQQKNKLDNDLKLLIEDLGTEETLISAQNNSIQELDKKRRAADKFISARNSSKAQEDHINDQIRAINNEMKAAKDVEAKRLELLRMRSHDAYQGVLWLRQNRDKFASTIHEPMLLNIHVKEASYSKYLETIIPHRDILAFVCEDKSDMNRLMGYLRDQQKLKINVVHSDPNNQVRTKPNIPMDNLRHYGFQNYLANLMEAPQTIMNYLISNYNIHNIPIGTKTVEDNIDHVPNTMRVFFSENTIYSVSTSKYSGVKSTRSSTVVGSGTLSIILDTAQLRKLTEKLETLNANKLKITETLQAIEVEVQNSNRELDELRSAKQKFQRNIQTMQSLKTRIHMSERKIRDLQNERTSVEEIKAAASVAIQKLLKQQLKIYAQYNAQLSDCFKFVTTNEETKFELEYRKRIFASKKNESQELRDRCARAEQTYKKLESELAPLRNETQRLFDVAMESTDNVNPSDKKFKPYHTAFAKLPFTIDEIDHELETAKAKVYCLGENADAEQILRNYEKAELNVRKLNEELENLRAEEITIDEKINDTRPRWILPLQSLIERINKNFSSYFSLMGCAGEVTLNPGDNIDDYDQYGLKIRVKFRDADELQELTRQRQSGGERAVTTAVYMIALQELSRVPFRCVDEINQGMDAINERRVFELIVQITGRANSCQYFLLTPKLLPDLEYGENVTVHCVFNGAYMVPYTEFDTTSFCERLNRR